MVEGPGYVNWDFSVFKNITVAESKRIQFRGELFNLLNHTNFRSAGERHQFAQLRPDPNRRLAARDSVGIEILVLKMDAAAEDESATTTLRESLTMDAGNTSSKSGPSGPRKDLNNRGFSPGLLT